MNKKAIIEEINFLVNKLKNNPLSSTEMEKISRYEVDMLLKISEKLYLQLTILDYLANSNAGEGDKEKAVDIFKSAFETADNKIPAPEQVDLFGAKIPAKEEKQKNARQAEVQDKKPLVQTKPKIDDLFNAIAVNDRFLFANELFGGNVQEFNVALQQLNTSESLESAMFYIESLQQLYNWNYENETLKRLIDLVDRRYSF